MNKPSLPTTSTSPEKRAPLSAPGTQSGNAADDTDTRDSFILPMVQGLKVLVLGRNAYRCKGLVKALQQHNIRAISSTADQTGYKTALTSLPDVVVGEMVKPGEPGWWLFQRMHRHPLLRWIPCLLMNWWKEDNKEEVVQTRLVLERICEALGATRVLEERIAAGRKLTDRVERIGIQVALQVLTNAGLSGTFSVNDGWNMFEVEIVRGRICQVMRNDVDGRVDTGEIAFLQLVITAAGNWTFRDHDSARRPDLLEKSLSELMDGVSRQLGTIVGPDVTSKKMPPFGFDKEVFQTVASSMTGAAQAVCDAICDERAVFEQVLDKHRSEQLELEQAVVALVRKGAVRIGGPSDESNGELGQRFVMLLDMLSIDHRMADGSTVASRQGARSRTKTRINKGRRDFGPSMRPPDPVVNEHITDDSGSDAPLPSAIDQATVELSTEEEWTPPDEVFDSDAYADGNDSKWRRNYQPSSHAHAAPRPYDSLAPDSHHASDGSRVHMWMAVGLALLMAGALIVFLVLLATGPTTDSSAHRKGALSGERSEK